ncbi:MAG TPA: TonB family protein [Candidatus Angelobacter sp.]
MKPGAANGMLEGQKGQSAFFLARAQREGFLRHFGFRESPFGVTPNPEFLFWSRMHNAALQALTASIESNLGFSVLLGGPGTGKTTLLFHLLAQYRESARTAFVFQTQCRAHDLIRHIASELELPVDTRDEVSLHQKLNEMLSSEARAGRKVVIVVDEAQNLQASSLEAIRLLSDFETGHSKLLHVVLAGSTRLGMTLLRPELSQFAQRISSISRLQALAEDEVKEYVRFRLAVVTSQGANEVFSSESLAEIASRSEGVPRIINSLCYRALLLAYAHGQRLVSRELVTHAAKDLDLSERSGRDSAELIPLSETREARISNAVASALPVLSNEPRWKPMAPGSERPRALDIETTNAGPSPPGVPNRESHNIYLGSGPLAAEADQDAEAERSTAIWNARRSIGLMAAVVLLACGSWVGWKGFRWEHSTIAAAPTPEAQPSVRETKNEIPLNAQSNAPAATKRRSHQQPVSPLIDGQPNVLPLSEIRSQGSIPEEPLAPINLASTPANSENLALLAATSASVSPRLEPPVVGLSNAHEPYSRQPIKVVKPEYPKTALLSHVEGAVQVELTIDQNGNITKVRGLSGNSILLQAAEEAARQWKYSPAAGDETSSPIVTRVQFRFKLNQ